MTKFRRRHLQDHYEKYRINGTVDPQKVYKEVQRDLGKRSWESSEESAQGNDDSSDERAQLAPWNPPSAVRMDPKKLRQMGDAPLLAARACFSAVRVAMQLHRSRPHPRPAHTLEHTHHSTVSAPLLAWIDQQCCLSHLM